MISRTIRRELRRGLACLALLGWLCAWAAYAWAVAQPPTEPPAEPAAPAMPRPAEVQNVKPDVFYLRDKNGELVLVPDFSLEEWERLYQQDLKLQGPAPPPFVLERVLIQGTTEGMVAHLNVRIEISLSRATDNPVRVPLKLSPAILEDSRYEGTGEAVLAYDPQASTYVCWLRGADKSKHVITLSMAARLRPMGEDTRIELQLPDAPCRLELTTPVANADVRSSDEQFVVKPSQPTAEGGSRIEVEGLGGLLQLDWRATRAPSEAAEPLINATAMVTLTCHDQNFVSGEAQIKVEAQRGTLNSFHIQLPPGMKLTPREVSGYTLQVVETADAAKKTGDVVRVDLANPRAPPPTIVLSCDTTRPSSAANTPFDAVGFKVREAFLQHTELTIAVQGDWSVQIAESQNVRRVGTLTEDDRARNAILKFVYYQSQALPVSLQLSIHPQAALVNVEPTFVVRVREQVVRLDILLRCRARGAAARNLSLGFNNWKLLDVRPADSLDGQPMVVADESTEKPATDAPMSEASTNNATANDNPAAANPTNGSAPRGNILNIPLSPRLKRDEPFELRIGAERPLTSLDDKLVIDLPLPLTTSPAPDQTVLVSPATIIVASADSLELHPLSSDMPDLYAVSPTTPPVLPDDLRQGIANQETLVLQSASATESLQFVGNVRRRPLSLAARSELDLRVERERIFVQQKFTITIEHQPLRTLQFEAPAAILASGKLTAVLDDESLPIIALADATNGDTRRFDLELPVEHIGELAIKLSYSTPAPQLDEKTSSTFRVPIVMLSKDLPVVRSQTIAALSAESTLPCLIEGDEWTSHESSDTDHSAKMEANRLISEVRLRASPAYGARSATVVRQMFFQSAFTEERRLDRAAFHLTTTDERVEIQLPPRASLQPSDISVAIDGRQGDFSVSRDGLVEIPLTTVTADNEHVVEIWYSFLPRHPQRGTMLIELAQAKADARWARAYWQLAVPRDEHLLYDPSALTPESRWSWRGMFYGREPDLDQKSIEAWIGAAQTDPLPKEMNQYLFSALGTPPTFIVQTARRVVIVLFASGAILVTGLLLIYVPLLRQPGVLFVLAVLAIAGAAVQPGLGLLIAQASVAGLVLCLVASLMYRLFVHRPAMPIRGHSTDSARVDGFTTASPMTVAPAATSGAVPVSTTAPAPIAEVAAELEQ